CFIDYRCKACAKVRAKNPHFINANFFHFRFSFFLFYDCVCAQDKKQISKKDIDVISMPNKDQCLVHLPNCKVDLTKYLDNQNFRFDFAFDESTSIDLIYRIKNNIPHLYYFSELKFYAIYLNYLKN
ncbi:Kinesin KIF2A, partial [Brachionus plicatilis]